MASYDGYTVVSPQLSTLTFRKAFPNCQAAVRLAALSWLCNPGMVVSGSVYGGKMQGISGCARTQSVGYRVLVSALASAAS